MSQIIVRNFLYLELESGDMGSNLPSTTHKSCVILCRHVTYELFSYLSGERTSVRNKKMYDKIISCKVVYL